MRIATIRTQSGTRAARLEGDELVLLSMSDAGELLKTNDYIGVASENSTDRIAITAADFAPLIPRPSKIICVGLNYRDHILEQGRDLPKFPTLFAKYSDALIGANDDIVLPDISTSPDWEVELCVVVGRHVRRASVADAHSAIAGFTVINDVSMRDWQRRTLQWLQGKTFERTSPVGPFLVTGDEVGDAEDLEVRCEVDGDIMQRDRTSQLLFRPRDIVSYCSQIFSLEPGDLIATGTPGGIGEARTPPVFLKPGQTMRTYIEGIGECVNRCVEEVR